MSTNTTTVSPLVATRGFTPGYTGAVFTVPVAACCGVLPGDEHDCDLFAAEAADLLSRPVVFGPSRQQVA